MAPKAKGNGMKGISRIESKSNGYGWYVRTYLNGKTYSKFYADSKYGGKERALKIAKKAKKLAEEQLKPWRKRRSERRRMLVKKTRRNKTGVVGISRTKKTMRSGNTYEYFVVNWVENRKPRSTSISIHKYGEDEAFKRAVRLRDEKMRMIHGKRYEEIRDEEEYQLPKSSMLFPDMDDEKEESEDDS